MQTVAAVYRSSPATVRTLREWRADLAEAEAVALRVRRSTDGLSLFAALGPLGVSRLLDVAVAVYLGTWARSPLRAAGCATSLAAGLGCVAVLAWWAARLRPALRADRADLGERSRALRAELPAVAAGEPFGEQVYGMRLAALERLAA